MDFIGSDAYYDICIAALAILIILLIGCQIKAKRTPKRTPPPPSPRNQGTYPFHGMKFQLQYLIVKADGRVITKGTFAGSEKNIVPCLEMMKDYINSQIELYEKLYEKVLPNLNPEDLEDGKPVPELLKDFIESEAENSRPRYAAGDDMDRINRNAHVVDLEDKPPKDPSMLLAVLASFFIFFFFVFVLPSLL